MNYYRIPTPAQWLAGHVGDKPFYYDCADCGASEPPIAGFAAKGERFEDMGIIEVGGLFKLAVFCAPCFEKRLAAVRN